MANPLFRQWGWLRPTQRPDKSCSSWDAAGRFRTSFPQTLFDSKLSSGKLSEYWSEKLLGGGTATHDDLNACVNMAVATNGDAVIIQTRQRWNYQPDKSQRSVFTCRFDTTPGLEMSVGPCHGDYDAPHTIHDGVFFKMASGVMSVNIKKGSQATGAVRSISIPQSQWNMDKLDGSGPSGKVSDWTKVQRLSVDYLWHGVGPVRFWVDVEDVSVCVHEEIHSGVITDVYMSNGTQPIRYEIRSTGGAGSFKQICTSVASEGGAQRTGVGLCVDTDGVVISAPVSTITMLLAVRIQKARPECQIFLEKLYTLNTSNNNFRWLLMWNPTIVGTPNYVVQGTSVFEVWRNTGTAITMTGGHLLDAGYSSRDSRAINATTDPTVSLGLGVDGTQDVIALGVEGIGGTATCAGGIGLRQLI